MLQILQSHRLDELAASLGHALSEPLASVMASEVVVVPSKGIGRWLGFAQARADGICANINFVLPASFLWQLLRRLSPALPPRSDFDAPVLRFAVLRFLDDGAWLAQHPRLAEYLRDAEPRRRFELAGRIADLYDQYQIYRGDWLAAWAAGKTLSLGVDESWQAALWQALCARSSEKDRARLVAELGLRLQAEVPAGALPERLFLFGVGSLQPIYLDVFAALSRHIPVYLLTFSPCVEYWAEIKSARQLAKLAQAKGEDATLYLEEGHPLLASWGGQGRDFFALLMERLPDAVESAFIEEEPPETLLGQLQRGILTLMPQTPEQPGVMGAGDRSVSVQRCHSRLRELEVLHDALLARFAADPDLRPDQIVVLVPDIEAYAPYIHGVFGRIAETLPTIPYALADREQGADDPLWGAYAELVALPESRFEAAAVLALLEHPAVLRRFGLEAEQLPRLRAWVVNAQIRWGQDGAHKARLGLPPEPNHTWRWGLDRLLLGFALPLGCAGQAAPLFAELYPCDEVEGSGAEALAGLVGFVETLMDWSARLSLARTAGDWQACLLGLFDDFFEPVDEEEALRAELVTVLAEFAECAQQAGYTAELPRAAVQRWLVRTVGAQRSNSGFLTGAVTFGTMMPMRSIPFDQICVLGMDFDGFPRRERPADYDLMAAHPRLGDRSRRADDRYLFLETLFAARQSVYFSYIGRDIRTGAELPPSVLLSELLEYIDSGFIGEDGQPVINQLVTEHALQGFNPRYFEADARHPGFNPLWARASALAGRGLHLSAAFFPEQARLPAASGGVIEFEDVLRYFQHPARYLLSQRLGLRLEGVQERPADQEPFELEYFEQESVRLDALKASLSGRPESAVAIALARGSVPAGAYGQVLARRAGIDGHRFAAQLTPWLAEPPLPSQPFSLQLGDVCLRGLLSGLSAQGQVEVAAHEFRARAALSLWLKHLLLCAVAPPGCPPQTYLVALDGVHAFAPVADARAQLQALLALFVQGQTEPLPLFPKSAYVYARTLRDTGSRSKAFEQAHKRWQGGWTSGESDDAYYALLYRGQEQPLGQRDESAPPTRFEALAEAVWMPLLDALQGEMAEDEA